MGRVMSKAVSSKQNKRFIYSYTASSLKDENTASWYNVLINLDGTVSPMLFDTKRSGLWYFDGQVFYQKGK